MASVKVGVRELKTRLSAYVRALEDGATVIITDRNKPVGRMTPIQVSLDSKLHELAKSGLMRWNGKKYSPAGPRVKSGRRRKIADIVAENRG